MNNIIELKQGLETAFIDKNTSSNLAYKPQFVSNNYKIGKKVLVSIEDELLRCDEFYISVAFINMNGITPFLSTFKELEERGIKGYILTTDYLTFSEPKALEKLNEFSNIEIKMYASKDIGFHTKGYIFKNDNIYKAIVGSSNMTASALTKNKEWNTKLVSTENGEFIVELLNEFKSLWSSENALNFDEFYDEYKVRYEAIKQQRKIVKTSEVPNLKAYKLEPNLMQAKFIKNLSDLRQAGEKKALLVSATGTGKTYAAAFALRDNNVKRILFIVHREQIAKQAMKSFKNIFGDTKTTGLLSGNSRDTDKDIIFATMQMMSKKEIMEQFEPDTFDTIVIDEAHMTGANSYQKIMEYFTPIFWLGMTASPERSDDFDVYEAFDHNVALEIRLQQAMEEDLLCPFHYFGIIDMAVDGELIDEKSDFNYLVDENRVDYIIKQAQFYGHSGDRVKGLVFCSRLEEANKLSSLFNKKGYKTEVLSGSDSIDKREATIERLVGNVEDKIDYIFTVDVFNEGVDIPEVNQVIMLRPTKSPIIFIQQLGRGLRKSDDKGYVVILDFIGNYDNNYMIPIALSGDRSYNKDNIRRFVREGSRVLAGASTIHFDKITKKKIFESIDNFKSVKKVIKESYRNLKFKLGRVPLMYDFYENGEVDPRVILNEYKSYYDFLLKNEKSFGDIEVFDEKDKQLLEYLYKIVVRGKRPHEVEILKEIVNSGSISRKEVIKCIKENYKIEIVDDDVDSAIHNLSGYFVASEKELNKCSFIDIVSEKIPGNIEISADFKRRLENSDFKIMIKDIIDVTIAILNDTYKDANLDDNFIVYEKYSRRDVCQLMNCEKDLSSTMYGMKRIENDAFLFVTYNKETLEDGAYQEGKPDYADEFIDNQIFMWDSKIGQKIDGKYVKDVKEAQNIRLFIKKSDGEGSDFYYMGKADILDIAPGTKKDNNGKVCYITKFKLKLENEVREDLFDYLHSN